MTSNENYRHELLREMAEQLLYLPNDYLSHMPWLQQWLADEKNSKGVNHENIKN